MECDKKDCTHSARMQSVRAHPQHVLALPVCGKHTLWGLQSQMVTPNTADWHPLEVVAVEPFTGALDAQGQMIESRIPVVLEELALTIYASQNAVPVKQESMVMANVRNRFVKNKKNRKNVVLTPYVASEPAVRNVTMPLVKAKITAGWGTMIDAVVAAAHKATAPIVSKYNRTEPLVKGFFALVLLSFLSLGIAVAIVPDMGAIGTPTTVVDNSVVPVKPSYGPFVPHTGIQPKALN